MIEEKLVQIVTQTGKKKDWEIFKTVDFNLKDMDGNLNYIKSFIEIAISKNYSEPMDLSSSSKLHPTMFKQVLFYTIILFVICFRRYALFTDQFVLYEKVQAQDISYLPKKKRKLIRQDPKLISTNKSLLHNFTILTKLNNLILDLISKGLNLTNSVFLLIFKNSFF